MCFVGTPGKSMEGLNFKGEHTRKKVRKRENKVKGSAFTPIGPIRLEAPFF